MALPTISLDDRTFEQLFAFMRKQIDTVEWSDHNLSDPGIVLLDLLCWIGEMILYRADRVPEAHLAKFAELILDPPEPVTVPLTLTATLSAGRLADLTVPAGTRFTTDFRPARATTPARRFVFETIEPATFRAPQGPQDLVQRRIVTAREWLAVENEALGVSSGQPDQTFTLRPVHADLGLPRDAPTPVLLDFVPRAAPYAPNPRVTVAGTPWELRQFLLTEQSRIDPAAANPARTHFMVDREGQIRFGDGIFGSIPAAGATIVCTRYQLLQGPDALIAAGSLVHQLDAVTGLLAGETMLADNGDAEGGGFFFRPEERHTEGLKRFHRPFRLITAADFEQVMLVDFNEVQTLSRAPERVLRATALMNRQPLAPTADAPGHVTMLILAVGPARGHVTFSDLPAPNSTLTLNSTTWTFVAGAPAGNQTRIGPTLDATLTTLAVDLAGSTDAQVVKCIYTADTVADRLEVRFGTAGAEGDRFTLAASPASNGVVSGPTLADGDLDAVLTDPARPAAQKQLLIDVAPALVDKIERFLDKRRLITTRRHVLSPTLIALSVNAQVAVARERNVAEMTATIEQRLRAFLGVTRGGFDGKGWPVGGYVYRSKLFRLIEDIEGVDHVEALTLTPSDANADVAIGPLSLPALAGLSVSVSRA